MDPQTTWQELQQTLAAGDTEAARELALVLVEWLAKGGFPPQVWPGLNSLDWNRRFSRSICLEILKDLELEDIA